MREIPTLLGMGKDQCSQLNALRHWQLMILKVAVGHALCKSDTVYCLNKTLLLTDLKQNMQSLKYWS